MKKQYNIATQLMKITYPEEKEFQTRLVFTKVPKTWTQEPIKSQMKTAKVEMKVDRPWMNYFLMGDYNPNSEDKCPTRFNPLSPYYQAWFGGYMLKNQKGKIFGFKPDGTPDLETLLIAGIGDQSAWLMKYGLPKPISHPMFLNDMDPVLFNIKNRLGFYWEGTFLTQSDLRRGGSTDWRYNQLFGVPEEKYFDIVNENHFLILNTFYICGFIADLNVTWVLYGCAAKFDSRDSKQTYDYTPILKPEMLDIARNTIIP